MSIQTVSCWLFVVVEGSVLVRALFTIYKKPLGTSVKRYGVKYAGNKTDVSFGKFMDDQYLFN